MKKRQIIIVVVAVLILVIGKLSKDYMSTPPEKQKPEDKLRVATVFAETVDLSDIPIEVITTGSLEAMNRMELFSEVQGLMLPDQGRFRAGNSFSKGQTLISLRDDDVRSRVVSQRSAYEKLLSSVMPDIHIDYPEQFESWSRYLNSIDVHSALPPLPEVPDEQLKRYLTGRNVFAEYHSVKNAEIGLSRYHISAPFSGVLTSANVDPGTVVRPGQLLGVFVKPGTYELMASADSRTAERLKKGQKVSIFQEGDDKNRYEGIVSRVNPSIDIQSQMSSFFVEVISTDLKDGQFMNLSVQAETINDAYEIDRSAIKDSRFVYVVDKEKLKSIPITILHTTNETAVIRGLENGQKVLTKLPPAAFEGMQVKIYSGRSAE